MMDYVLSTGAAPPAAPSKPRTRTQESDASDGPAFGDVLKAKQKEELKSAEDQAMRSQTPGGPVVPRPDDPPAEEQPAARDASQAAATAPVSQTGNEKILPVIVGEGEVPAAEAAAAETVTTGVTDADTPAAATLNPESPDAVFSQALAAAVEGDAQTSDPVQVAPAPAPAAPEAEAAAQSSPAAQPAETASVQVSAAPTPAENAAAAKEAAEQKAEARAQSAAAESDSASANTAAVTTSAASDAKSQSAAAPLQQSAQANASAAVNTAQRVDMVQQLVAQMSGAIEAGKSTMKIQLHPAELGAIELHLISSASGVSVSMVADQLSTGKMLENQLSQLRQSLADAGIQLTGLDVSHQNLTNQQQNSAAQQNAAFSQQSQHSAAAYIRHLDREDELQAEILMARPHTVLSSSAVDYRI